MTKSTDAAQDIRRLAVQYQGMVAAADLLEKYGSMEQAIDELGTQLARSRAALAEAQNEHAAYLRKARDEATAEDVRLHGELEDARLQVEESKRQAGEHLAKAAVDAEATRESARADARRMADETAQMVDAYAEAAAGAKRELAATNAAREAALVDLEATTLKLENIRAAIAALVQS